MRLIVALLVAFALMSLVSAAYEDEKKFWVWPKPTNHSIGSGCAWLDEYSFKIQTVKGSFTHDILTQAFKRYEHLIGSNKAEMSIIDYPALAPAPKAHFKSQIPSLHVKVLTSATNLDLKTDESYNLTVTETSASLVSNSVFGALRGLETFAQLVQWNGTVFNVKYTPIHVTDRPAWPWRGMLIDTARHYLSISQIKSIIDSMVLAKLNVFHWHITDAESFPIVLPSVPEFSQKGAWSKKAIYTEADVAEIIKYALYRGVRVVPEIDTPGHTYSMGKAYPDMIFNCTKVISRASTFPQINSVALNMTNDRIYPLLDKIYSDVANLFPDQFIHVGGDEVQSSCLEEFGDQIRDWMRSHGMDASTWNPLLRYFRQKLTPMITDRKKKMIVWQEALEEMIPLGNQNPLTPDNTYVHVWLKENYQSAVNTSLQKGYRTILSGGWYLDQQLPNPNSTVPGMPLSEFTHYLNIDTWKDFYKIDPLDGLDLTPEQEKLFIGGEVAQWAEAVMPETLLTNIWPRAAAAAERLWVGRHEVTDTSPAYHRLIRFQCYLYQRGVRTSGLRPSYCTSAVFNPPYVAGGHKVAFPIWGLIILGSVIGALLVAVIALSVQVYQLIKKEKRSQYESLN